MVGPVAGYTPTYNFAKVRYDVSGWSTLEHGNWALLDAMLSLITGLPGVKGVWANSTPYLVGDRTVDDIEGGVYRCLVAHTSDPSSTFAADRAANPTYWEVLVTTPVFIGNWATTTAYSVADIVAFNTYDYYYCIEAHTSGVFATDLAAGKWTLIWNGSAAVTAAQLAETNAETAETNAAASAALADADRIAAASSASSASTSASTATTQAGIATTQAGIATTQASNASTSASTATTQASNASTSATTATTQAGIATTQASNASASAAAAAASAASVSTDKLVPSAAIAYFAQNTAPTGWLKANGAAISRTTYAALFAQIGTVFGVGDGSTTFNVPDLRGEFLRGWDDGRGVDTSRAFGSFQAQSYESHTHTATADTHNGHTHGNSIGNIFGDIVSGTPVGGAGVDNNDNYPTGLAGIHSHVITVNSSGGTETRPRNVALLACIKF